MSHRLLVLSIGIGLLFFAPICLAQEERATSGSATEANQTSTVKGLDKQIDDWFRPIADGFGNIVLVSTPQVGNLPAIPVVVLLLVVGALYFTVYFRFVNLRLFRFAIQIVSGKYASVERQAATEDHSDHHGEVSHFQAVATAVSGTVGLGNIAGVAVAIAVGGPGACFWMMVCGLLGMSTKFVECTLGVCFRDIEPNGTVHGGPMYYLSKGLKSVGLEGLGKFLGVSFAVLCIGASLGGGNMFQANQCTQQIQSLFGLKSGESAMANSSGAIIGLVMAILVAVVIIGGIKRIAKVTDKMVPFMAILYLLAGMVIIILKFDQVPQAFYEIIVGAFSPMASVGGVVGVIITGFRRAAFSNEAGAGSAAIAHSAVQTRYPASEGVVALLEPFIDTVVICTMTAVIIVLFNSNQAFEYGSVIENRVRVAGVAESVGGVDLTSLAFDSVLPNFRYVLTVAIILFAFSTMISWSYYGLTAWKYLFGRSAVSDLTYKVMYCAFVVIGAASSLQAVIDFSDAMILALVFPNMLGLFLLAPRVKQELDRYLDATKRG
jgi:AGCS family alanine or glycine:cation symporter